MFSVSSPSPLTPHPPLPHLYPANLKLTRFLTSFINNEFVKGVDGKTFDVINPSTEKVICAVHEATEKDVDIAVSAARKAFEGSWRHVSPEQRGRYLVNLANLFEENLDTLAAIESLDNGKAVSMAKIDIGMCAGTFRYYGGWADKIEGKVIETNSDTFNYTKQEPVSGPMKRMLIIALTRSGRCLRSNHPVELPVAHVRMEGWSRHRHW